MPPCSHCHFCIACLTCSTCGWLCLLFWEEDETRFRFCSSPVSCTHFLPAWLATTTTYLPILSVNHLKQPLFFSSTISVSSLMPTTTISPVSVNDSDHRLVAALAVGSGLTIPKAGGDGGNPATCRPSGRQTAFRLWKVSILEIWKHPSTVFRQAGYQH